MLRAIWTSSLLDRSLFHSNTREVKPVIRKLWTVTLYHVPKFFLLAKKYNCVDEDDPSIVRYTGISPKQAFLLAVPEECTSQ